MLASRAPEPDIDFAHRETSFQWATAGWDPGALQGHQRAGKGTALLKQACAWQGKREAKEVPRTFPPLWRGTHLALAVAPPATNVPRQDEPRASAQCLQVSHSLWEWRGLCPDSRVWPGCLVSTIPGEQTDTHKPARLLTRTRFLITTPCARGQDEPREAQEVSSPL